MPRNLEPPPIGNYTLVCPHCETQNPYNLLSDQSNCSCPNCGRNFQVLLATVRAKRGRASKGTREYVIRTITQSGEHVLRFTDAGGSDLDLRSRDIMYICYKTNDKGVVDEHPSILCNDTTNQYTKIKKGCFIATATCGYNSLEVEILSSFRDNILSRNKIGLLLTRLYYLISPYLACCILEKARLKKNVRRFMVSPIAMLISKLFKHS